MTVSELIEELKKYPPDMKVFYADMVYPERCCYEVINIYSKLHCVLDEEGNDEGLADEVIVLRNF
jgi:hypothetical protein